jgi:hypothetical protein
VDTATTGVTSLPPDGAAVGAHGAPQHRPLSQELSDLLDHVRPDERLSLNDVFLRTEGRGLFLFIILLCLPFVTPISIPGVSNVLGAVLALLGIRLAFGLAPCLPPFIGGRPLPPGFQKILRASTKVVRFLERWARPRKDKWMGWPAVRFVNGLILAFMAVLLALPLPPLVPFTNTLPAYAILFLALSIMEEDGVLIWAAYALAVATCGYFYFLTDMIALLVVKYAAPVQAWFQSWL